MGLHPLLTKAIVKRFDKLGADTLDPQDRRAVLLSIEYHGTQHSDWPLKDGLAMIKAGVMDEAIKEALSMFTPLEAQLAEADPAGQ